MLVLMVTGIRDGGFTNKSNIVLSDRDGNSKASFVRFGTVAFAVAAQSAQTTYLNSPAFIPTLTEAVQRGASRESTNATHSLTA
jgi:hypothetical protein